MAQFPSSPYDEEDDFDPTPESPQQAGAEPAYNVPKAPPISNPVIQSYDTPAQAASNTVPQQPAPPQPRQPAAPKFLAPPKYQPPAAPARQPQPVAQPAPVQPAAPAATTTASPSGADDSSLESLTGMLGNAGAGKSADDAAEEARQQELRNQAATNKYQRSQGVQMQVTPTGQTQALTDAQGNPLYKPEVLAPLIYLDDQRAYRVTRNEAGNEQYFDLERDGVEGSDYHVDPHTGEKFVSLNNPDGGSRREVIGQDAWIPKINGFETQRQRHVDDRAQAAGTISALTNGVQGAEGLGSLSLEQLHAQAGTIDKTLAPAIHQMQQAEKFRNQTGTLNGPALDAYRSAQATLDQLSPQRQAIQDEVDARQQEITTARQQHDQSSAAIRVAATSRDVLSVARRGQGNIAADLGTIATGGALDVNQAARLSNAGLLVEDRQEDGSIILRVSREATSLLDPQTQKQLQANPTAFNVMPGETPGAKKLVKAVQKALPKEDAAQDESTDPNATPAQRAYDTLSSRQAAGQPLSAGDEANLATAARSSWADSKRAILAKYPQVGVAGSPANVAFVQAFRQSGGDHRGALKLARGLFQDVNK